jgi:SAM-dependent methyltransferase
MGFNRRFVTAFSSDSPAYQTAFQAFLDHTDQKRNAFAWLSSEIERLPRRDTFIDAGAGNGQLTARLVPYFDQVIAVEPNPSLVRELRTLCPTAEVLDQTIDQAMPRAKADFILCSHILYYIPLESWVPNTLRLAEWLNPGGVLAIAIQNPETDCMKMVRHFVNTRLDDLSQLEADFRAQRPDEFDVHLETVPAHIRCDDLETACTAAEFILNIQPIKEPPLWQDLEGYVADRFRLASGGYQFSCHQDFLRIQRRV